MGCVCVGVVRFAGGWRRCFVGDMGFLQNPGNLGGDQVSGMIGAGADAVKMIPIQAFPVAGCQT